MKKTILGLLALCLFSVSIYAQEASDDEEKEGWTTVGTFTFLLNQSGFSNWQAGGENAMAANVKVNYDFNYKKGSWLWDNKLIASYGLTNNEDDGVRKNDDRIEFNSIVGHDWTKFWSFSFFLNFRNQFTNGYDYEDDFINGGSNEDYATSGLFKPAYLSFGPGALWKKNDNLYVNISPITSKFTIISDEIFTYNETTKAYESSNVVETFGVAPGDNMLYEFGMNIRAYYKFNIMENISMENILNLYSNYIDRPQNVDIDYTMNVVMKINDSFSTNLTFQTIYDDNAFRGFQVREVFGLGINYGF